MKICRCCSRSMPEAPLGPPSSTDGGFLIGPVCVFCWEDMLRIVMCRWHWHPHNRTIIYSFEIDNHMYSDLPLGAWI